MLKRLMDISTKALAGIACLALFAMVVIGAVDVIGRYVFNNALTGAVELSKLLMAAVIAFTWAYTQFSRGHARVEFVIQRFPRRVQRVLTMLGDLLVLVFFGIIGYELAVTGADVWDENRRVLLLDIPIAIMYWLVSFAALVTCVIVVLQLVAGSRLDAASTEAEVYRDIPTTNDEAEE